MGLDLVVEIRLGCKHTIGLMASRLGPLTFRLNSVHFHFTGSLYFKIRPDYPRFSNWEFGEINLDKLGWFNRIYFTFNLMLWHDKKFCWKIKIAFNFCTRCPPKLDKTVYSWVAAVEGARCEVGGAPATCHNKQIPPPDTPPDSSV